MFAWQHTGRFLKYQSFCYKFRSGVGTPPFCRQTTTENGFDLMLVRTQLSEQERHDMNVNEK